ncbi:3-ketoacyl-CoA thiolase @ Acetyl-CoA acetyltransferase [Micrococcus lylae]|uniref:3-ketoacyl-CoA thiolase @ Acetyl-CoA acetyltransferase n=1 Tax=Micrococcus lylae TaxID=1273 RepID=A0A1R4I8G0_9MICC|nr:acetyl-CoA C-acetyltransferase [Micrococcus lylae]TFI00797.1 acetyl-CoA C-acetyltransferase [Micrococcus lylae]SJN16125.1 3-ketoacyl-CoA thiolase @ Acetyl-CoA acetyltransferase [Micrococcus lylae]
MTVTDATDSRPAVAGGPLRKAVVVGGNRIPFARANTAYADASNQDMLTAAIEGLVARCGLQGERLGQVAAGAVLKHPRNFNLTRESVLGSSLSHDTPAMDLQVACATGMEALGILADKIRLGQIDSGIGGGVDSISDSPISVSDGLRRVLLRLNAARTGKERLAALKDLRPGHLVPEPAGAGEPRTGLAMGEHQALTTHDWGVTRAEQDELALASHQNLAAAYDSGYMDDLVTPFRGLAKDNNLRGDSTLEKLGRLKPAFGRHLGEEATMTAANSTPLTDGASAVLVSSEQWAAERRLPVLAEFVDHEIAAVDFVDGDEGLLMAPVYAVPRLLGRHGLTLEDLDFIEIHEAFAGTVLSTMKAWEDEEFCRSRLGLDGAFGTVDRAKLNVHGSSLAAGHPFAATGGRITALLAKMLHEKGEGSLGLISVCAAGGQGVVALMRGR